MGKYFGAAADGEAHLEQVLEFCALLDEQVRHMEAPDCVPAYVQLLVREVEEVVDCLIVYLAVGGPAAPRCC